VSIGATTRKILWARSGGRCTICKRKLVMDGGDEQVGAEGGDPASGEPTTPPDPGRIARIANSGDDRYDNLILVCAVHYGDLLARDGNASGASLSRLKTEHEEWVRASMDPEPAASMSARYDPRFDGITLLPRVPDGRTLVGLLGGIHSLQYDHDPPGTEREGDLLGRFLRYLIGIVDVWDEYDAAERDRVALHLDRQIGALYSAGLLLCCCRYTTEASIAGTVGQWVILRVWILSEGSPGGG
jgi:hypothetical protein